MLLALIVVSAAATATACSGAAQTSLAPATMTHGEAPDDRALVARIDEALARASRFLVSTQAPDGAWRSTVYGPYRDGPTLTPYVLTALHLVGRDGAAEGTFARGRTYVQRLIGPGPDPPPLACPVYTAAPATWVIGTGVQTPSTLAARSNWLRYLRRHQLNAARGWTPGDPEFGGWGYAPFVPHKPAPGEPRPPGLGANLSATVYALGALRLSGVRPDDPVYAEILTFVSRCQNFPDDPAHPDPEFDDGGFFFTPGDAARNKAGVAGTDRRGRPRFRSYGSMTADGLRALLHAGLPPDHPRVVAARRWLARHFRADTNPGTFQPDREVLRDATYYYYCWSVAHAFMHLRARDIDTEAGTVDWPHALAEALMSRQGEDGAWRNRFTDTREDDPLVATPAAAAALQICRHALLGIAAVSHRMHRTDPPAPSAVRQSRGARAPQSLQPMTADGRGGWYHGSPLADNHHKQGRPAMTNVNELNSRFGVPGVVTIDGGRNGMPRVRVTSPVAEAEIYLHGAHVTHFQPRGHKPVLFMSGESLFDPAKAIRGGVPLIFPWFGQNAENPKAPQHGFARTTTWTVGSVASRPDGTTVVTLTLGPSDGSRKHWPHEFEATFTVTVGKALEMALEVVNRSSGPIRYEEALHTYLAVGDIRRTTIDGLAGRTFIDKVDKARRKTQPAGAFALNGETDRVYVDTPDTVTVDDAANGRKLVVSKSGSASTVVWNPWVDKAKAMADFGDEEWPGMLCIETANAADNAVQLAPGARHTMRATIAIQ